MASPLLVAKSGKLDLALLPALGGSILSDVLFGKTGPRGGKQSQGVVEAITKSAARAIGSELGRKVLRGVLGSILGGSGRR